MSRWTKGPIVAALSATGMTAVLTLASGSALADPEPAPPPPPAPGVDAPPPPAPADPLAPPPPANPLVAPPAPAPGDPLAPPPPAAGNPLAPAPAVPASVPAGPVTGQNPAPFAGEPPFVPPTFNPVSGSTVGVGEPIIINFARPIADQPMAEKAIHVSSTPPVSGKFYWMTPSQVRWRPLSFWPAHTAVHVDAAGTIEDFRTGDALTATADDATHQLIVNRNRPKFFHSPWESKNN